MKNGYDLLKVIAILLVVIGHTTNHYTDGFSSLVTKGIYLFHMPLFIAISGAVYELGCRKGKYGEFMPFFVNKVLRLLVPFAFTAICVLAPILYFLGRTGCGYGSIVWEAFIGGTAIKQLWYLEALFEMFIIVWVFRKVRLPITVAYVASFGFALVCALWGINLKLLCVGMMIQDLPHFIFGILIARYAKFTLKGGVIGLVMILLVGLAQILTSNPLIDNILRLLLPETIVFTLIAAANLIFPKLPKLPMGNFILVNSFAIYLFHMSFIYIIRALGCDAWPLALAQSATIVFALVGSIASAYLVRKARLQVVIGEK